MKLPISQLVEGENSLHYESSKDSWVKALVQALVSQGYELPRGLSTDIRITKLEPDFYLRGQMEFDVGQECSRCAEHFQMPIRHDFEALLEHAKAHPSEREREERNEVDVLFFEAEEIDLEPLLREQFFLSLPYRALCKENCLGVCQKCGKNLNSGSCHCEDEGKVTPFAVLKKLKVD